eukprot:277603_1
MSIVLAFSTNWLLVFSTFIMMGFMWMLCQHSFDPKHIIMDIDDEEAIIIIQVEPNATLNHSDGINILDSNGYRNDRTNVDIILSNPLNNEQCQNANIDRHNISKVEFIATYYNETLYKKCRAKRIWDSDGIWTREYLNAISTQNCFMPRLMRRTEMSQADPNTTYPVYYHIPKSASSSTAAMAKEYFNFGSKWVTRHDAIQQPYNATHCGFTFVRDPIKRFISGYYTVNAMIYGENELNFVNHTNNKYEHYKFIKIMGEPQRFETFLDEIIENSHRFYGVVPLRHIASQTYFLSNWYGSNIHFVGKVENYSNHWLELLNYDKCGAWFRNKSNIIRNANIEHVIYGMYHHGFDVNFYTKPNKQIKYKEYIEAMSLEIMIDNMYKLPPMYHKMTEKIYNKIVDFYYQDFKCFGYSYGFQPFVKDVEAIDGVF